MMLLATMVPPSTLAARAGLPSFAVSAAWEAAAREAAIPHLWLDFRRAVVLARKPG